MMSRWPFDISAVFFDLDGTLADTITDLADAVDKMLLVLGKTTLGEQKIKRMVGKGMADLVFRALQASSLTNSKPIERDSAQHQQAVAIFRQCYREINGIKSQLYPGVAQTLAILDEYPLSLACITNKPEEFTKPLLDQLGIGVYFDLVVGGDTCQRRKPDPDPLEFACRHFSILPQQALMVGDSSNDIAAARAAGCPVVQVTYGYSQKLYGQQDSAHRIDEQVDTLAADALVSTFAEIINLIPQTKSWVDGFSSIR